MKYCVGDFVKIKDDGYYALIIGKFGTVDYIHPNNTHCDIKTAAFGTFFYIPIDIIERLATASEKNKTFVCPLCGNTKPISESVKDKRGKKICCSCVSNGDYCSRNNKKKNKPAKNGLTFGFEFECIPFSLSDKATIINSKYSLMPTDDCSLPSDGVEFKSPTFCSMRGFNHLFEFMNKHANLQESRCGTHINVGHKVYNHKTQHWVHLYQRNIFYPLYCVMDSHRDITEKVCGRFFTDYAQKYYDGCMLTHGMFINLNHSDRIEFRISKFRSPKQFMHLTRMWGSMMQEIVKWAKDTEQDHLYANETSKTLGKTLVDIFQKYADTAPE